MSWVTPLGSDIDDVWQRLLGGETARTEILENEQNGATLAPNEIPKFSSRLPSGLEKIFAR